MKNQQLVGLSTVLPNVLPSGTCVCALTPQDSEPLPTLLIEPDRMFQKPARKMPREAETRQRSWVGVPGPGIGPRPRSAPYR